MSRSVFNVRVLQLGTIDDARRAVAAIEPYPERVQAAAPKIVFYTLHAAGITAKVAMILKQELLALDADCVIAPAAYLGDSNERTDALIAGTARQLAAVTGRLRAFPLAELPTLAEEIERALAAYTERSPALRLRGRTFVWGERTWVMGILNVTPDSFSGDGLIGPIGGAEAAVEAVVDQARTFVSAGADLLDIGGESTRPGATPVSTSEECGRVVPAIAAVHAALDVPISVDTWKAEVAEAALDAGAELVNDVWGLRLPDGGWNEALANLVARRGAPIVLMHNCRAKPSTAAFGGHYAQAEYEDLLGEIIRDLRESVAFAEEHGITRARIIVDPGIGFGKTPTQNIEVLRRLRELRSIGLPVLLGTSRKSFIGRALKVEPQDRVEGTGATVTLGINGGVDIVRVHDVAPMVRMARMADAIVRPGAWERLTADDTP